ncbi:MAG: VIT1/CCC1 transporter family protein [Chloroflexota bacterium]
MVEYEHRSKVQILPAEPRVGRFLGQVNKEPVPPPGTHQRELVAALRQNWLAETEGAHTYRVLAEQERDPQRQEILLEMADAEKRHAEKWANRLRDLGSEPPQPAGSLAQQVRDRVIKGGGTMKVIHRMEADEDRDIARYQQQLKELRDPEAERIIREALADEQEHRERLQSVFAPGGNATQGALDSILRRETWHRVGGGWIGDAIYGVNDGLGAIFGIVSGVSGATAGSPRYVILAGLAGMFASALSMGSGAYLSTKSEREMHEAQLARERQEIREDPEEERHELELIYRLKGFSQDEAKELVDRISQNEDVFLDTLAQNELGITQESAGDPVVSAISGGVSTAIGAIIPIIPFFFLSGYTAIIVAAVISLMAHFGVGAAKTLVTIRSWWSSGLEMTVVGAVEGIITYALGVGIGQFY